jgi:hypothetical protein
MNQVGDLQRERILDGLGPIPVRVVTAAVLPPCAPGSHCAAHCDGPFPCCVCGMAFEEVNE